MTDSPTDRRRIQRTLLIDADDTLWENNVHYLRCTAAFLDYMADLGFSRQAAQDALDATERELIPTLGYSPQNYITALGLACRRLADQAGRTLPPGAPERAERCGHPVLDAPVLLLDQVEYTLRALRPTSRLVMVTKGDRAHQMRKLERSGLGPLFDATYVLFEKEPAAYRRIVAELGVDPHTTWMVGNSPGSDINPAVRAGLGAIYIPHERTWSAEVQPIERPEVVVTLRSMCELLDYFDVDGECEG